MFLSPPFRGGAFSEIQNARPLDFQVSEQFDYSNSMSKTSRYNGTYAKDDGAKLKVYFQIEKALKKMLICCFEGT